jgi:tRNA G37 N-methylase TrmD
MKEFLVKMLKAGKIRQKAKTEISPFTTVLDWSNRFIMAKDDESKFELYQILAEVNLTREDIIFLIALFEGLDERVMEIVSMSDISLCTYVSLQEITDTREHSYWSKGIADCRIKLRKQREGSR